MNSRIRMIALTLALLTNCKGNDSKTQAALNESTQDTSLARDLALAGGDTLLYAEAADVAMTEDTTTRVVSRERASATRASGLPESRPEPQTPPAPHPDPAPAAVLPARSTGNSCASADAGDQRRCLMQYLARSDASLNRTYQRVIGQLAAPAEERLRAAQRAWLVTRDTECRRKTKSSEGPLWAPVRAKCLGEYSAAREAQLAAMLR